MKRQRAEISSNVISHIKSAHPIEMWRSNKLGIKEKISRGKFPRLTFSCPVPSGLPHRSHCVPMNMNPSISEGFGPRWETRTPGLMDPNLSGILFLLIYSGFQPFPICFTYSLTLLSPLFPGVPAPYVVIYVVKNASRPVSGECSPVPDGKRFSLLLATL